MSYSIDILETPEQIQEILPEWLTFLETKPLGMSVYNDPRFILGDWEQSAFSSDGQKLHIIVLRNEGQIGGIFPLVISKKRFVLNLSVYKRIQGPKIRQMSCYGDALIHENDPNSNSALFSTLLEYLSVSVRFDMLYLQDFRTNTPFAQYCIENQNRFPIRIFDILSEPQFDHQIELPETFDQLLASRSSKHRYNMRREQSAFDKQFPETRLICCKNQEDVSYFLEKSDNVRQASWKSLTFGFVPQNTQKNREKFLSLARHGWLRSYLLLSKDEEPLAFVHGYEYYGVYYTQDMCFEQSYANFSPGKKCLYRMVQELLSHNPPRLIDFGFGSAEYKRIWGNVMIPSTSVYFVRSIKGTFLVRMQKVINRFVLWCKRLLERWKVADRIRKILRRQGG